MKTRSNIMTAEFSLAPLWSLTATKMTAADAGGDGSVAHQSLDVNG